MSTEPKFYAVDALNAYPEPVGTDDKLELNLDMGAVYIHLNYKRAKLVGLQSLDFLISQLEVIRAEALGEKHGAPVVELPRCECGSSDVSIGYESPQGYWVECGDCGYQTEKSHSRESILAKWQARAAPVVERQPEQDGGISVTALLQTIAQQAQWIADLERVRDEHVAAVRGRWEPVSALDERAEFEASYVNWFNQEHSGSLTVEKMKASRDGDHYGVGSLGKNLRWLGWQARAALDKVKELNQSSTIAGFKVVEDPAIPPNEVRICNCNQGRLPCSCKS